MEVSLIILTYNSEKYIDGLLRDLTEKYKKELKNKQIEIIIADNASSDKTVLKAKSFKEVIVVENGGNFGFAKGNNLAAKKAHGNTLIFLNPDTKIIGGNIFNLTEEFRNPDVGVVGGKIQNSSGGRELSCGKEYNWFNILLLSMGLEEVFGVRFAPDRRKEVDFVSGAFLAINRFLYEKVNGFDEHYFMYIEDADLCYRIKKEGFRVIFSEAATIQHVGQGSSNRTFAIINIYKGLLYFQKKHKGILSFKLVRFFLKTKASLLVLCGKVRNNQYLVSTYEEALKATR